MPTNDDSRDSSLGLSATTNQKDPTTSNSAFASDKPGIANPYDMNDPNALRQIKKRMEDRWKTANHRRWLFELSWLRNVLFALGIQWVRIDWPGREIRNLSMPTNFPRAICNKYFQVNSDLWTQIVSGDIPVNWTPATDDERDQSTADICERLREVIDGEIQARSLKRDLGFWHTYCGNSFLEPEYDYSPVNGTQPVPQTQCANCGMLSLPGELDGAGTPPKPPTPCPQCAAQATIAGTEPPPPQYGPAIGPDGNAITKDMPIGKLACRVRAPFEVYWDNVCRIGTPQTWYFTPNRYDVSVAKALFEDFADKITEGMDEPLKPSRNYLIAIAYAGSYLSGTTGTGEASAREELRHQVTAWRYREMPTPEYPQGVEAIQLGTEIVSLGPLKTTWGAGIKIGQPFLPLIHFYQEISGGAWGKPRANDLVSIQSRRNIIDSNLQLTAQRTGAPKMMTPMGAGLKNVTGEAGQVVEYKPISFGGTSLAKPEYLEAALGNVQPLILLIKELDDMQETIAGTKFVAGGDAPSGVTAASALAFLNEKANRANTPLKEQYAESWGLAYQYLIEIARQHWTDERMLSILGRNKQWQFYRFKKADLSGAVNVSIDYEALFPKSPATERANLMTLGQMGFIDPTDPEQAFKILEKFGQTDLHQGKDDAIAQAAREWDAFLNDNIPPKLLPIVQDSVSHLMQHKLDAQTQEFEELMQTDPQKAEIWIAHIQTTMLDIATASQPLVPPPPGGPGAPPPGPAGPPPGPHGSQKGSQHGAAKGNAQGPPRPIVKGQMAADGGAPNGPTPPPPAG